MTQIGRRQYAVSIDWSEHLFLMSFYRDALEIYLHKDTECFKSVHEFSVLSDTIPLPVVNAGDSDVKLAEVFGEICLVLGILISLIYVINLMFKSEQLHTPLFLFISHVQFLGLTFYLNTDVLAHTFVFVRQITKFAFMFLFL